MTIREWAESYLVERAMFPDQARAVVGIAMGRSVASRWSDPIEEYPVQFTEVLAMDLNRIAVEYIDANFPEVWFRPMFAGEIS